MMKFFSKSVTVNVDEEEARIRSEQPHLLHQDETIELAFRGRGGKGRDAEYFTSHRVLIEDGKGIGSKRKNFKSIPYSTVLAYSVQTAGHFDVDSEFSVWNGNLKATVDFSKSQVDIFEVYQFLNAKISMSQMKGTADYIDPTPPNMNLKESTVGNMLNWLGDDAQQIGSEEVEEHFKTKFPILLEDEKVDLVFKSGRDFKIFTNKRLIWVDAKGFTGKKVEFLTILYSAIHGFSVETAGGFFDRDTELRLHLPRLGELSYIKQDFRDGKANLWAIQKVLCNHVLGEDKSPIDGVEQYQMKEHLNTGIFQFIDTISGNLRPIDSSRIERILKLDPPVLQGSEQVEMAFQGYRDITLFTTKRVLTIDKKGLVAKKIMYMSLPWEKIVAFGIRTAGRFVDFDTEVQLHTELHFNPGSPPSEEQPGTPATPEQSCLELDFSRNCVDIFQLKYYLSKRIVEIGELERGVPLPMHALTEDISGYSIILSWLGNDQYEFDPSELDREFHTTTKILMEDEKILMAFKAAREISLFTNLRVLTIDIEGLIQRRMLYTSLPYRSIHGYAVQSAGMWDFDSEVILYTRNRWHLAHVTLEFQAGKTDIMQIQKLLSGIIIGRPTDSTLVFGPKKHGGNQSSEPLGFSSFATNSTELNPELINEEYHDMIPLLLDEETVLRAFKQGRDMFIYTNRRLMHVDKQGLTGKKVKYMSIPYKSIDGFVFETAGNLDRDAEIYAHTNISVVHSHDMARHVPLLRTKQSILVKHTDIYEIGKLILDRTIFDQSLHGNDVVPEIEFHY